LTEYRICSTAPNPYVDSQALIARYRKLGISGVFFVPTCDANKTTFEHSKVLARQLTEAGIAVIVFDREMARFPENGTYDFVGIDNMDAGYRQARHLIEHRSRVLRSTCASTIQNGSCQSETFVPETMR